MFLFQNKIIDHLVKYYSIGSVRFDLQLFAQKSPTDYLKELINEITAATQDDPLKGVKGNPLGINEKDLVKKVLGQVLPDEINIGSKTFPLNKIKEDDLREINLEFKKRVNINREALPYQIRNNDAFMDAIFSNSSQKDLSFKIDIDELNMKRVPELRNIIEPAATIGNKKYVLREVPVRGKKGEYEYIVKKIELHKEHNLVEKEVDNIKYKVLRDAKEDIYKLYKNDMDKNIRTIRTILDLEVGKKITNDDFNVFKLIIAEYETIFVLKNIHALGSPNLKLSTEERKTIKGLFDRILTDKMKEDFQRKVKHKIHDLILRTTKMPEEIFVYLGYILPMNGQKVVRYRFGSDTYLIPCEKKYIDKAVLALDAIEKQSKSENERINANNARVEIISTLAISSELPELSPATQEVVRKTKGISYDNKFLVVNIEATNHYLKEIEKNTRIPLAERNQIVDLYVDLQNEYPEYYPHGYEKEIESVVIETKKEIKKIAPALPDMTEHGIETKESVSKKQKAIEPGVGTEKPKTQEEILRDKNREQRKLVNETMQACDIYDENKIIELLQENNFSKEKVVAIVRAQREKARKEYEKNLEKLSELGSKLNISPEECRKYLDGKGYETAYAEMWRNYLNTPQSNSAMFVVTTESPVELKRSELKKNSTRLYSNEKNQLLDNIIKMLRAEQTLDLKKINKDGPRKIIDSIDWNRGLIIKTLFENYLVEGKKDDLGILSDDQIIEKYFDEIKRIIIIIDDLYAYEALHGFGIRTTKHRVKYNKYLQDKNERERPLRKELIEEFKRKKDEKNKVYGKI